MGCHKALSLNSRCEKWRERERERAVADIRRLGNDEQRASSGHRSVRVSRPISFGGRYTKGARFEHEVARYLADRGWFTLRSSGSHGLVDVIACRQGVFLFIQCKGRNGCVATDKWNALYRVATENNAVPLIARPSAFGDPPQFKRIPGIVEPRKKRSVCPWYTFDGTGGERNGTE